MKQTNKYDFTVNSLAITAEYYQHNIDEIFIPLLKKWSARQAKKQGKLIIFLAAPPGVGKTTLSLFLEYLSTQRADLTEIQAVGLDGFHYHQDYIKSHTVQIDDREIPMKDVKGCPETFDIDKVETKLSALMENNIKWPVYDRKLHDVIEDQILLHKDIILIEGNWLLLNEDRWRDLKKYCDYSMFIKTDESILKERLIQRKVKGGSTYEDALSFYINSDSKNIRRVLDHHLTVDTELELLENGEFMLGGKFYGEEQF